MISKGRRRTGSLEEDAGVWRGDLPKKPPAVGGFGEVAVYHFSFFFLPPPQKYCFKKNTDFCRFGCEFSKPRGEVERDGTRQRQLAGGCKPRSTRVGKAAPQSRRGRGSGVGGRDLGIAPWAHEPAAPASAHTRTCWLFPVNVPGSP